MSGKGKRAQLQLPFSGRNTSVINGGGACHSSLKGGLAFVSSHPWNVNNDCDGNCMSGQLLRDTLDYGQ